MRTLTTTGSFLETVFFNTIRDFLCRLNRACQRFGYINAANQLDREGYHKEANQLRVLGENV
jgi:hypothetical protein